VNRSLLATLAPLLALSCDHLVPPDAEFARASWLRDALIQDNRDLLERAPEATAGKLRKMASSSYGYFRGTAAIYWRDQLEPRASRAPTSHSRGASNLTLLVGDPHPENIGSFLGGDGRMHIEFNDFDASTYGPYHLDVRRLALGYYVLARASDDLRPDAPAIARAVASGYAAEIASQSAGDSPASFSWDRGDGESGAGVILGDLIRRAERDGDVAEELLEYAPLVDGERAMFHGTLEASEVEGVVRDRTDPLTDAEDALVAQIVDAYFETIVASTGADRGTVRVKGASRRLGAGVSSYPVRRFYVLTEGRTDSPDDDLLLELKETLDPPPLGRLVTLGVRDHASNAERVVSHQRLLQARADQDPWLGWARLGPLSFRVRHRTKYQKGVDAARVLEEVAGGEYGADAVLELATQSGRLLAASHTRAPLANGQDALAAIAAALGPDADAFADETADFARSYGDRTLADYELFKDLLEQHGFDLGYRPSRPPER
jgi:uncharacterized protein (DUF2252 family)